MKMHMKSHSHPCRHHSQVIREHLHKDTSLGCGNFLSKVLNQNVDKDGWLFSLERPFVLPWGVGYQSLSLNDVGSIVANLATWLRIQGVEKGQIVLIYTDEGISQFIHSLAAISIGAIAAPVNWRMNPEITLLYFNKYSFDHLLIDSHENTDTLLTLIDYSTSILDARPNGNRAAPTPVGHDWQRTFGTENEVIMLCHSSGTTGVPKAVEFGHQQFFAGKRERLLHFLELDEERMLSALPHSHSAGFSYLMTAVLLGLPTRVISNITAPSLADELTIYRPTIMAGFSQTYAALSEMKLREASIPTLRRCYNTGDTAHEAHIRSLLKAAPDLRFHDGFGASELGMALFCAISSVAGGVANHRNVGKPVPFAAARILDECNQPLPPQHIGYLAVRSPTITTGYYKDSSLTARCQAPEGYWITGDVGYLTEDGAFIHLDRAVDTISTPLGTAYSLELEEAVLRGSDVHDVAVVGAPLTPRTSEAVIAWLRLPVEQAESIGEEILSLLDKYLFDALHGHVPVAVVNIDPQAPTNTGATGKTLKRLLRDEFWPTLRAWEQGNAQAITYTAALNFYEPCARLQISRQQ